MEKKLWYAVQETREDEWGTGSFDLDEAYKIAHRYIKTYGSALIAVIDANYDEDGNPTCDPVCIDEIEVEEM